LKAGKIEGWMIDLAGGACPQAAGAVDFFWLDLATFLRGSTCRTSVAIWRVLTQSSTATMPRGPMIIFDETVVAGTILILTPLLKSMALSPPFENNGDPGRAQQLKWFGSAAEV
jgi:hypothetical protein